MNNFILREQIKKIINEFFNGTFVYSDGPNKFPYLNGTDEKTPSDLNAEFDSEFGENSNEIEESKEAETKEYSIIKNTTNNHKH